MNNARGKTFLPNSEKMYNARGKTCRDDGSRRNLKDMPSFSSSLLDEIYRSFDGNAEKSERRQGVSRASHGEEDDDEIGRFRRVEKWMEKEKVLSKRRPPLLPDFETKSLQDNDLMFFSSTSSSSDSSGALSSSDTEFFGSSTKTRPKVSCFSTRPRPVRTGCSEEKNRVKDDVIKSKSRALKMYANLKKVKQPISPGGRLTSFINSLFSNANGKKSKATNKVFQDLQSPTTPSTCSSFSRSCLSKYSPGSREKMRNGAPRTVRFHPVSVIVDEDSRPCGHKCIDNEETDKYGRPPLPPAPLTELKTKAGYSNSSVKRVQDEEEEEEDEDDCMSDASSDLFELDHLALFGNNRFCEELPVYETTRLGTNRAIASGLIR